MKGDGALQERRKGTLDPAQGLFAGIGAVLRVQLADEKLEPGDLLVQGEEVGPVDGIHALEHHLEVRLEEAYRGAELVRRVLHHFPAEELVFLERGGHAVEVARQLADLVTPDDGDAVSEVAGRDALRCARQGFEGRGDLQDNGGAGGDRQQGGGQAGEQHGEAGRVEKIKLKAAQAGIDHGPDGGVGHDADVRPYRDAALDHLRHRRSAASARIEEHGAVRIDDDHPGGRTGGGA